MTKNMNQLHPRVARSIADVSDVSIHDHAALGQVIRSPQDFSDAIGIPLDRITKSLFLRSKTGAGYALVVLGMNHKLDFAAASEAAGVGRLEVGKPEELAEVLGYPRNGVSPLGIPGEVPVLIDAELHNFPTILIGGGATGIEIEIAPDTLAHLTGAVVVSLSALP